MNQSYLIDAIKFRRQENDKKFGECNHTPIEWTSILMKDVEKVRMAALQHHNLDFYGDTGQLERYESECIQVGAVALAMLESLHRNEMNVENSTEK